MGMVFFIWASPKHFGADESLQGNPCCFGNILNTVQVEQPLTADRPTRRLTRLQTTPPLHWAAQRKMSSYWLKIVSLFQAKNSPVYKAAV